MRARASGNAAAARSSRSTPTAEPPAATTHTFSPGAEAELCAQGLAIGELGRVEAGDVAREAEMLACPLRDRRQAGAEAPGDDVAGVADEERPVAQLRVARDVLDHLGVVVGGEERLALAAAGHRHDADEVGQPHVGRGLQRGVLVQEVVDLPGLVGDPEVEALVAHEVVEDHEVGAEDLVEPAQHPERVELVLARLGIDVRRLGGELGAGRVDALAARLEHRRDRVLREPLDLEPGVQPAQLVGDGDVAPDVAESDRRADEERAARLARPRTPAPRAACRRARRTRGRGG